MLRQTKAFIGGEWRQSLTRETFEVRNPFDDSVIAEVEDCGEEDVDLAIAEAEKAFKLWKKTTAKERSILVRRIGDLILKHKDELAAILTEEQGKPLAESAGEVAFTATFFHFYAEECTRDHGEMYGSGVAGKRYLTVKEPLGVAALVCPWNFPVAMPGRKMAAALAAGCTCVIKPAEDTPLTSLALASICAEAGLPSGVLSVVPCSRSRVEQVGSKLCQDPRVSILSFTGSCAVGQKLYSLCGDTVKRLALELGGNAPFIVFESADLDKVVPALMGSKYRNSGQTCVCADRILVQDKILPEFFRKFLAAVSELKLGNGAEKGTTQGPLVNHRQLERLEKIVSESVSAGAVIEIGGAKQGPFYLPTILTGVTKEMPCWQDETFGPVAAIRSFETEDEAVTEANDTDRGLAAFLFTSDLGQAWRVSSALEAGMVGVNDIGISTAETPFGGYKMSGLGKEGSRQGLEEYTQTKLIDMGGLL